jgi:hypothetical protein
VPESLERWLFEASVRTDLAGVLTALASNKNSNNQNKNQRHTNRSQIFLREETKDEMANA